MRGHLGGTEQAEAYGVSCGLRPVPRDAEEAPRHAAQAVGKPEREGGQGRGYDARHTQSELAASKTGRAVGAAKL